MPIASNTSENKDYEVAQDGILYDEIERQGTELPHGCLAGSCGACKVLILEGTENLVPPGVIETNTIDSIKANYKGEENLEGQTVRLACRAKVTGDIKFKPLK